VKTLKIPEATIIRLSVYSRFLAQAERLGVITVSSGDIASGVGVSSAQVRKDLAYFGEFGTRGVGYNVSELYRHTKKILGLNNEWSVVIVGAGKLGSALAAYGGFRERGFCVEAIFDNDPDRIGKKVEGLEVLPIERLQAFLADSPAEIGVIAVPAAGAQEVCDQLVSAGIKAILNFAPRVITVPDDVVLRNVDLSVNLEILTFNLYQQRR
jgi:redox-sensing transcriptional repressor